LKFKKKEFSKNDIKEKNNGEERELKRSNVVSVYAG
jgi:hypothetical protein